MIQKYFKHGDKRSAFKARFSKNVGVNASIEYQLGMIDANGNTRNFIPVVLRGNTETYLEVVLNGNFKNEYTAGVLRFVEKDIDMNILQEIMKGHEEMTFPGLEPHQYVALWILHKDKDGIELHFNYGKEELTTGKKLKPFIYDRDLDRMNAYKNYVNAKYDFADPNDPKFKQSFAISDNKLPADVKDIKGHLDQYIDRLIDADVVYDRETVLEALDSHEGIEVSRTTKNAISVSVKGRKQPVRLKGQVYQEDFTKETLSEEYRSQLSDRYKEQRPVRAEEEYEKAMKEWNKRAKENRAYYIADPKEVLKAEIKIAVEDLVIEGKVNKRSEIAEFIRNEYEQVEEVVENNKHHLSVKIKDNKRPFRITDDFYKRDFDIPAYRESLKKEEESNQYEPIPSNLIDSNADELRKRREEEEEYYYNKEYGGLDFVRLKDSRWNQIEEKMLAQYNLDKHLNENYVIMEGSKFDNNTEATAFDISIMNVFAGNKEIENNKNKEIDYGREANYERNQRVLREIVRESGKERRGYFGSLGRIFNSITGRQKEDRRFREESSKLDDTIARSETSIRGSNREFQRCRNLLRKNRSENEADDGHFRQSLSVLERYVDRVRKELDEDKKLELRRKAKQLKFD